MLDEIAGRLADLTEVQNKLLEHIRETTPEGVDFPISDVVVTSITVVNFVKDYPYRKIRSLDPIFNKGPNTAYIRVNEEAKEIPVEDREDITISRPRATIEYIRIRVASEESATMRMIGHF
jgi:signal transduction protein with GAF and PtsI domain